jgi:hypothetical protein
LVAHSFGDSLQNSIQPIGGREVSPTETWIGRSCDALAAGIASMTAQTAANAVPAAGHSIPL